MSNVARKLSSNVEFVNPKTPLYSDCFDDLKEYDAAENVIILLFSEFGRRIKDNGSGSDHGAA